MLGDYTTTDRSKLVDKITTYLLKNQFNWTLLEVEDVE